MLAKETLQSRPNALKKMVRSIQNSSTIVIFKKKSSFMESCSCVVLFIWSFEGHISDISTVRICVLQNRWIYKFTVQMRLTVDCAMTWLTAARLCSEVAVLYIITVKMLKPLCCMTCITCFFC